MRHIWRRYYNLHTDGGGGADTLDSPGSSFTSVTVDTDDDDDDEDNDDAGDLTKSKDNASTNNPNSKTDDADKTDGTGTGDTDTDGDGDDEDIYSLAHQQLGYDVSLEDLPEGLDGLVEFNKRIYERGQEDAEKSVWETLNQKAPAAVELARWLESGRSEHEFYATRMSSPRIEPDTLTDETPVTELEKIVYNNFLKQGMSETMAKRYTTMAVDANTILEDAKEIVKSSNAREDAAKAEADAKEAKEQKERYDAFVAKIEGQIEGVRKTGALGDVKIPQAKIDQFIQNNFYDAGNPEYPGLSVIDIKLQTLAPEKVLLYRYLVDNDFNFSDLITTRAKSINVKNAILKGRGNSKMSGHSGTHGADDDDRTLDSPGS